MLTYMKVFPECVLEGAPSVNDAAPASFTLSTSEKVSHYEQSENARKFAPHFRKGYFKRLQSDYYTNKEGQVIFVSETMVNGSAKTVRKSDDEKKLAEFASGEIGM